MSNEVIDKILDIDFKIARNKITTISVPAYIEMMQNARTYIIGRGKNEKSYNIVHTSGGFVSVNEKDFEPVAEWLCDPFEIKAVVVDEKNTHYAELEANDKTFRIPFESFLPNKIHQDLFNKGIAVSMNDGDYEALSRHLQWLLAKYEKQDARTVLGWKMKGSQLVWSGANTNPPLLQYHLEVPSETAYMQRLNALIKDCPALQFVLCAAASATLLAYLHMVENVPVASFGVSLVGTSSTGKTTALNLAASLYSAPDDEAVYSGFYGTSNALIYMLGKHQGVPLCYDESTISNNMDKGNFVYAFVEGKSKLRLDQQSQLRERETWLCTCLFSSETYLVDVAKHDNLGLGVRIINLDEYTYTRSSQHADEVKKFATTNYGIIGSKLSEYLLNANSSKVNENYQIIRNALTEHENLEKCPLTDRLLHNYAVIIHTACIFKNIGINVDVEALTDICIRVHNKLAEDSHIGKNTIIAVFNYITSHPNQYKGIKWITTKDGKPIKVAINENTFNEILDRCGITDIKGAIRHLDKEKYLLRQNKTRLKSNLNIDGINCYAYQFEIKKVNEAFGKLIDDMFSNINNKADKFLGKALDVNNDEEAVIHDGNYKIEKDKNGTVGKAFLLNN